MKRMFMVLLAVALSTAALTGPKTAEAACQQPACFASPSCCVNRDCDSWCGGRGLGLCQGATAQFGGCCACVG